MAIIVHHLNDSRSQRILWLLEEMGIDYEIKHYARTAKGTAPPELLEVHPTGKSPLITDTKNGKVVAESGAIVDYLIRHYGEGRFVPTDTERIDDDVFWNHFAEGSLMPTLVMKLVFSMVPPQMPFFVRPIGNIIVSNVNSLFLDPDLKRKSDFIADELVKKCDGGNAWFAGGDKDGNPTAADFQMAFPLEAAMSGRISNLPAAIKTYVEKVHARPAFKRGLEKGGPYKYA
ncbi:Glutathione S-transferase, N-terminal [Kalmanozyma brasiliensis GHG001]|uniref:glutathione transferase n=1 Tax=Kalmanozyma brasiliensis (strain GHG001) TaxID=1365824 RepID=V5E3C0_KALBG|nr:Glutathione S-transferase, N-terminal [Kalmanozyma brasiliensis GHG001]EST04661.1 Glutathione S-transferase, N-terminal [Kalmanozyma brasiliensis GHG001]